MTLAHANACKVQPVQRKCWFLQHDVYYQKDSPSQQENILSTALWLNQKQVHKAHSSVINPADNKINLPWMVMSGTAYNSSLAAGAHTSAFSSSCPGRWCPYTSEYLWLAYLHRQIEPENRSSWQGMTDRLRASECMVAMPGVTVLGGGWLHEHF